MTASPPGNIAAWILEPGDPGRVALTHRSRQVTYQELRERVAAVAGFVRAHVKDAECPIVPLIGESSIDQVAAYLGVLYAGAIPAPVALPSAQVLRAIATETGARVALVASDVLERVQGAFATVMPFEEARGSARAEPTAVPAQEMASLMYTSGSTGRPRGVMVSTRNLWANASAILATTAITADDCALVTLPLYYCYGASVIHTHLRAGATVALVTDTFPAEIYEALVATGATSLPAVPSLIQVLVSGSPLLAARPPRLRYVMVSGGRVAERAVRELRAAMPHVDIYLRYGVTELTAAASFLPPDRVDDKLGSIGAGLAGAKLHVEHEDGTPVEPGSGAVGELVGRGDHVTLGYFAAPDETARSFRDGAFHTGDLATVDRDGFISIVGREKEFVKTGGHRVAPQEIEDVLLQVEGVVGALVCGVAHPLRGEALAAAVVLASGSILTEAAVRQQCALRLPAHKVPMKIRIVAELPRTQNGKLDRRTLAASLAS